MKYTINSTEWFVWEQNAAPMFLVMTLNAGMMPLREYIGMALWTTVINFEDNQGKWLFRFSELKNLGQKMIDFLLFPPYRVAFQTAYQIGEDAVLQKAWDIQFSEDVAKLPTGELVDLFDAFCGMYYDWYKYGWFCEPVQFRGQDILTAYLEKEIAAQELHFNVVEAKQALFAIEEDTFAVEITRDLLECANLLAKALQEPLLAQVVKDLQKTADFPHKAAGFILSAAQANNDPDLRNLLERIEGHCRRFYWKRNNYFSTMVITPQDVLIELFSAEDFNISNPGASLEVELTRVRENKQKLLARKEEVVALLPPYYRNLVALVSSVGGSLIDQRKRVIMTANAAFDYILGIIATRTKTELSDCHLLIPQELRTFVSAPQYYSERFEARRKQFLVFQGDFSLIDEMVGDVALQATKAKLTFDSLCMREPFIAEGQEAEKANEQLDARLNLFIRSSLSTLSSLQGVSAFYDPSEPIIIGTVTVIRDPKTQSLHTGDILVTPQSTPDYMDAIRRCKAIVTDYGSQTSHAAITARELHKPCIIGTNYASQILKTGDTIRLDLKHGTIEVLKPTLGGDADAHKS